MGMMALLRGPMFCLSYLSTLLLYTLILSPPEIFLFNAGLYIRDSALAVGLATPPSRCLCELAMPATVKESPSHGGSARSGRVAPEYARPFRLQLSFPECPPSSCR